MPVSGPILITDSSTKTITAVWTFDRAAGGTLVAPADTAFPGAPETGEIFWRTDESKLYRYNGSTWDSTSAGAVSSVFGRTGAVVAAANDYSAAQVSFTPSGNIAATQVQAAIQEVRDESVQDGDSAGGDLTGTYPNPTIAAATRPLVGNLHQARLSDLALNNAYRFDSFNDRLTATALPSSTTSYTVCGWAKLSVDRNAFSCVFVIQNAGGTAYHEVITDSDGTTLAFYDTAGRVATIQAMSVDTWYFWAYSVSGSATTTYVAAIGDAAPTKTTSAASAAVTTPTIMQLGSTTNSAEFFNGCIAKVRVWDGVLSDAEIAAEYEADLGAAKASGLIGDWLRPNVNAATQLTDFSGTSNTLTNTGGLGAWSIESGPLSNRASLTGTAGLLDGTTLVSGDRVLLRNQNTASQNGIWVVDASAWTRPGDWATGTVVGEAQINVSEGVTGSRGSYKVSNQGAITVGTTGVTFVQTLASGAGGMEINNVVTPTALSSDQNNYAPTNIANAAALRLSSTTAVTITGLTSGLSGREITLHNVGTRNIVLAHENTNSSAANRFSVQNGCPHLIAPGGQVTIIYDWLLARWIVMAIPGLEFLGCTVLTGAAANTSTITIPARDSLFIVVRDVGYSVADQAALQFNSDTGNNYWWRHLTAAAGGTTWTNTQGVSTNGIRLGRTAITLGRSVMVHVTNYASRPKVAVVTSLDETSGAGTAGIMGPGGGMWNNTANQITSLRLFSAAGNNLLTGTGFAVYGRNF